MPFKSKAQARAAFSGALGEEMREKAQEFADETPGGIASLPDRVKKSESVPGMMHTRQHLKAMRSATLPKGKRS